MTEISTRQRREVIARAGNRCEYCKLSQTGQEAAFHIDHIEPRTIGGPTEVDNLALACVSCSLRKGARSSGWDVETEIVTPLFHPRRDQWPEHFGWNGPELIPRTAIGRVTVQALQLNRAVILGIRREEAARGRHPPDAEVV